VLCLGGYAAWVTCLRDSRPHELRELAAPNVTVGVAHPSGEANRAARPARPSEDPAQVQPRLDPPSVAEPTPRTAPSTRAAGEDAGWERLPPEYRPDQIAQDVQDNVDRCPGFKDYYVDLDCSVPPCAVILRGLMVASISSVSCAQLQNTPVRFSVAAPGREAASMTVYFFEPSDEVFDTSALRVRGLQLLHDHAR
jgi:hypothetical protein